MEKELIIKLKGSCEFYTLSRGCTVVDEQNRKARIISKKTYDTTCFGMRKALRESRIIAEPRDSEEYVLYDRLIREGARWKNNVN